MSVGGNIFADRFVTLETGCVAPHVNGKLIVGRLAAVRRVAGEATDFPLLIAGCGLQRGEIATGYSHRAVSPERVPHLA